MNNLDLAFWAGDTGFLADRTHTPVGSVAGMHRFRDDSFANKLVATGRLPDLADAPVASWLLPRLAELTRGGLPLDDQQRLRNDGGCIWTNWIALSKALTPLGFFGIYSYPNRIVLHGSAMPATNADDLLTAFVAALIAEPNAIRKLRVHVTDTDPPSAPGTLGRTYDYGWDGIRFVGTREYV